MSRQLFLVAFVQHVDALDIFFTEAVLLYHLPQFGISVLGHHGFQHSLLLGEGVFAVQHDGVVIKRCQQPVLFGRQLKELVFQAFGRKTETVSLVEHALLLSEPKLHEESIVTMRKIAMNSLDFS